MFSILYILNNYTTRSVDHGGIKIAYHGGITIASMKQLR